MRIPQDITLADYINKLKKNNKIELFYQTDEWKNLRAEVQAELHNECQECLKYGRYTRSNVVHHVNHLTDRPDLALSKFYTDQNGEQQRQLIPLCHACHNIAHPEKGLINKIKNNNHFTNIEKW